MIENVPEADFRNNFRFVRRQPPSGDECAASGEVGITCNVQREE